MCYHGGGGGWFLQKIWNKLVPTLNDFVKPPGRLLEQIQQLSKKMTIITYTRSYKYKAPQFLDVGAKTTRWQPPPSTS